MSVPRHQPRALLRIPAHRRVASLLEGEYLALHPGRSTELADLREYVRGDDPKDLDWKASARARTLLVRRYHATRKLSVLLVVPTGRTMAAASSVVVARAGTAPVTVSKGDVALAAAGALGEVAVGHGDLVGVALGDRAGQVVHPPRGGTAYLDHCLRAVEEATGPTAAPSDLAAVLRRVVRTVRRRCLVVVVADEVRAEPEVVALLSRLRAQHEVLALLVQGLDPTAVDPDAAHPVLDVDGSVPVPPWLREDDRLSAELQELVATERAGLEAELDRLGVTHTHVRDLDDVLPALRELLERHRRARRR